MKHTKKLVALLIFFSTCFFRTYSQATSYSLNGSATQSDCNCYTLTSTASSFQRGSVWNNTKIDLTKPFDFSFDVTLGCFDDYGGDGMAFVLQTSLTSLGHYGEGLGYLGILPSVGITFDTWKTDNLNDPAFDHISIQTNGNVSHGSNDLAAPIPISATNDNVEDCKPHLFRVTWDPATKWLRTYIDSALRVQSQIDLVQTIFSGNPNVYWGFTGGTGGAVNEQKFCTALHSNFKTSQADDALCIGDSIQFFEQSDAFVPIASYHWDFDDGTIYTVRNPPAHLYKEAKDYTVKLTITSVDGCSNTLSKTVTIGAYPEIEASVDNRCVDNPVQFTGVQTDNIATISKWNWDFGDNQQATGQNADHIYNRAGSYKTKVWALDQSGCSSDTLSIPLIIGKAIAYAGKDTIVLSNMPFQLHGRGNGSFQWSPSIGLSDASNPNSTAVLSNVQAYELTVTTLEGCVASDSVKVQVFKAPDIYVPNAFTPNRDGRNDLFRPVYVGVKKLSHFTIYNRWGQKVFSTSNPGAGWDGRVNGKDQSTDTFIWIVEAEDLSGKIYKMKGAMTLIR